MLAINIGETIFNIINIILCVITFGVIIYITILIVKALRKYLRTPDKGNKTLIIGVSLGEKLKEYRMKNNMTQEFVAEQLEVSRQAVSKWENGKAEPSTSNLMALSKLYDVPVEELIVGIENKFA